MEEKVDCPYERAILGVRWKFVSYTLLAVFTPIVALLLCHFLGKPSMWLSRSGAVMAGMAFLADLKARDMAGALNPGGLAGSTYMYAATKYRAQIKYCLRLSVAMILTGTAVWGFGDLLPIGAD